LLAQIHNLSLLSERNVLYIYSGAQLNWLDLAGFLNLRNFGVIDGSSCLLSPSVKFLAFRFGGSFSLVYCIFWP